MSIKAIETEYNGNLYRSRLEAKWAVFFDAIGMQYRYETDGFESESGMRYLPDFYLPEYRTYVEVKGGEDQYHLALPKILEFIDDEEATIKRLLILGDIPYSKEANGIYWYPVLYYHPLRMCVRREYRTILSPDGDNIKLMLSWLPFPLNRTHNRYDAADVWSTKEGGTEKGSIMREHLNPIPDDEMNPETENEDGFIDYRVRFKSSRLVDAYRKARQARFEYGETPNT